MGEPPSWYVGHLSIREVGTYAATVAGIALGGPLPTQYSRGEGYAARLFRFGMHDGRISDQIRRRLRTVIDPGHAGHARQSRRLR